MWDYIFFIKLSKIHYELRLIDSEEFIDRLEMAKWLFGDREDDPRIKFDDNNLREQDFNNNENNVICSRTKERHTDKTLTISFMTSLGQYSWVFTKSDPDSYPSIPHGHLNDQNNPWPKLDPYFGKVFTYINKEDTSKRLNKKQLKKLWNNERFRSFCIDMIGWYLMEFPSYKFRVKHPLRLPKRR